MEVFKLLWLKLKMYLVFTHMDDISNFVYYKIIDETKKDRFVLQCINSKSIFHAEILEIVFNHNILYRLHPLQSCFIGIEYSKHIKNNKIQKIISSLNPNQNYGTLNLKYRDRKGDICYVDKDTNEEFTICPKKLAFSDKIITKFSADQAFYIGLYAGLKMQNHPSNVVTLQTYDIKSQKQNNSVNIK